MHGTNVQVTQAIVALDVLCTIAIIVNYRIYLCWDTPSSMGHKDPT